MRPGSIALTLASSAVAIGGLYLLLELRGGHPASGDVSAGPTTAATTNASNTSTSARTPERARPTRIDPPRPMAPPISNAKPDPSVLAPSSNYKPGGFNPSDTTDLVASDLVAKNIESGTEQSERLLEANRLYDRGDYDGARQMATKLLGEAPGNVKLVRVVVSSSCIMGDGDVARKYAAQLPATDLEQMVDRCSKFEIALKQ
jgi:hypothetical protein